MIRKARKLSEEHKANIGKANKGKKHTMETKLIISQKNKGKTAWNKGLTKEHPVIARIIKNLGEYGKGKKGKDHPNWKGGIIKNSGYIYLYNEKLGRHFGGKYIKKADYNWYKEKGELIKPPYELHHINGIKTDDRVENLVKLTKPQHSLHHLKETYEKIVRNEEGQFNERKKN